MEGGLPVVASSRCWASGGVRVGALGRCSESFCTSSRECVRSDLIVLRSCRRKRARAGCGVAQTARGAGGLSAGLCNLDRERASILTAGRLCRVARGCPTQDESPSCHAVLQASFCWCSGPQAQSAATVSAFTRHHLVAPRSRGGTTRRSKQSPPTNFMVVCCPSLSKSVAWHARLPRSGHGYLGRTLTSEPCFPLPSQASTSPRAAKRYSLDLLLEIKADSHAILSSRRP